MVLNTRSKKASDMANEVIHTIDNAINAGMSSSGPDLYDQFHSTL